MLARSRRLVLEPQDECVDLLDDRADLTAISIANRRTRASDPGEDHIAPFEERPDLAIGGNPTWCEASLPKDVMGERHL